MKCPICEAELTKDGHPRVAEADQVNWIGDEYPAKVTVKIETIYLCPNGCGKIIRWKYKDYLPQ